MITTMTFRQPYHCFKAGQTIEFQPGLNLLVGLNGCGKSTILKILSRALGTDKFCADTDRKEASKIVDLVMTNKVEKACYFDFEKGNVRTLGALENNEDLGGMVFQVQSYFASHGETSLTTFSMLLDKSKTDASVLLLDEPDQAASIRAAVRIRGAFDKFCTQTFVQIIASVHHPFIIDGQPRVLDVGDLTWKTGKDFIVEMLLPGPLVMKHVKEESKDEKVDKKTAKMKEMVKTIKEKRK